MSTINGRACVADGTPVDKVFSNGRQVYGRNLAQGTSGKYSTPFTDFSGVINTQISVGYALTDGLQVGDTVQVRVVIKYDNLVAADGKTAQLCAQGYGDVTKWNSGAFHGPWVAPYGSGEYVYRYSFTVTTDHIKNSRWYTNLRTDNYQSGSIAVKEHGVVNSSIPITDWTPAPEDVM